MSDLHARQRAVIDPAIVAPSARPRLSACTVLVVDDFNAMRSIIVSLLRQLGAERIIEAENGADACAKLAAGGIDFVVSDWNMPVMSGIDLLKHVRGDPKTAHIPFLLVTAEARKENIIDAGRSGADGYIVKPFSAVMIGGRITNILQRRAERESEAADSAIEFAQELAN